MARPLRLDAPGEFFHVLARGNERAEIFVDDPDRRMFLGLVAEIGERFDARCHGYCLMGNHYHLLLQPMRGDLPRALRQLNGIYAQRFNRRHRRSGHLFEGRYKCLLVDTQTYLLELARYIVLNPVRAGLVAVPEDWMWSSYRATAGLDSPPRFLSVEFIRRAVGGREREAGALDFRRLVAIAESEGESRLEALIDRGVAVGTRPFLDRLGEQIDTKRVDREIPTEHRMIGRPSLAQLLGGPAAKMERDARIRSAVLKHGYTQAAVAAMLGLGRATVSRAIRERSTVSRPFPES